MNAEERECWERFCQSGLVADYLEYRAAVGYRQAVPGEGATDADRNQGGGALGQEHGRV